MPNHVTNVLTVTGDSAKVAEFLKSIEGKWDDCDDPRPIDFNKIKPMPESLRNCSEGGGYEFTLAKALCHLKGMFFDPEIKITEEQNLKAMDDKQWEHFKQLVDNIRKYGYTSWYGWSIDNWGTKWNAYSQSIRITNDAELTDAEIRFDTAWSAPFEAIIEPLMRMWVDLDFEYRWADEDSGSNTGRHSSHAGVIDGGYLEDHSNEAYELYLELNPGDAEYIRFNEEKGEYEYYDEDEDEEKAA